MRPAGVHVPSVGAGGGAKGVNEAGAGNGRGPGGAVVVVVVGASVVVLALRPDIPAVDLAAGPPVLHAASNKAASITPLGPMARRNPTSPTGVSVG
jgi:hypothetical protein